MAISGVADLTGRVLAGRYRLLTPIGAGASGRVYVADDVRLRRRVAVKVLHAALAGDSGFLRRFRAEAQVAASLHHPNVMAVYDWGDDDVPFMVLELLRGGSLRALLDTGSRLSPAQAARVGQQVTGALEYAHARGLVHRDIKPANLLFDEHGILRVADFGLARALAEASWTEPEGSVTRWIGDLAASGDVDSAAQKLWERYFDRLVHLARDRLRAMSRGPADAEDATLAPDLIGGLADRDRHQQRPEVVAVDQAGEAAGGGAAAEAVEGAERGVLGIRRAAGPGAEPVPGQVDQPVEVALPELLGGRIGGAAGDQVADPAGHRAVG